MKWKSLRFLFQMENFSISAIFWAHTWAQESGRALKLCSDKIVCTYKYCVLRSQAHTRICAAVPSKTRHVIHSDRKIYIANILFFLLPNKKKRAQNSFLINSNSFDWLHVSDTPAAAQREFRCNLFLTSIEVPFYHFVCDFKWFICRTKSFFSLSLCLEASGEFVFLLQLSKHLMQKPESLQGIL